MRTAPATTVATLPGDLMTDDAQRIRVLLVDDHAVVRMGLRAFFDLLPDIEVVGEAADGFVRKTFKPGDLANAIARCMDHRVADVADDLALATAGIARIKGEPGLVTVAGQGSAAGGESVAVPDGQRAESHPDDPSSRPVPIRGAGLVL
ncbi:MAG TPA: hypothetical protein VFQ75_11450 [Candidatus Limnocylindrales bacterium]|nr:hypothetical protein [Candidatus Limnocylindrales bacterium]